MKQKIILTIETVKASLDATNSISQAAVHAGVKYQTFRRRVSEFGLDSFINMGLKNTSKPWTEKHYQTSKEKQKLRLGERIDKAIYYQQCQFNLAGIIDKVKGYELLQQFGMYSIHSNLSGVVRDHRYSINHGFKSKIDPKIISHPANCEFLTHKKNASKSNKSSITLEQLQLEIEAWNGAFGGI